MPIRKAGARFFEAARLSTRKKKSMIKWRRLEPDMFPAHDSSGPPNAKAETPAAEMGAELPSFGVWGAQSTRKRLTAQDVISARFEASGRRGESYLAVQVDDFLDEVAWSIAQYEKGSRPTQATLAQICLTLGMPRDFFGAGATPELLPASSAHFRSLRSTTSKAREQVLAYGELSLQLVDLIADYIDFPPVDLPDLDLPEQLTAEAIEDAASQLRAHWGLEPGPVPSIVQLLEAHGVIVLRLPGRTDPRVDALSTWAGKRPLVFLSRSKEDKARSRFDGAHELGHLLLHPDTEPGSKLVESEANAFASELLMPREQILEQLPRRIDWQAVPGRGRAWAHDGWIDHASHRLVRPQI